eukprot:TRINITY_DN254_c0_g1_i6.p1 TRINITY_DN254_c0_g1~~TRINITY_DN254_c0_g1_i6.p1  ORF type:complete len:394 (-),score=79.63 TRINITY_DN254_c0_g1_i6:196-1377(-)
MASSASQVSLGLGTVSVTKRECISVSALNIEFARPEKLEQPFEPSRACSLLLARNPHLEKIIHLDRASLKALWSSTALPRPVPLGTTAASQSSADVASASTSPKVQEALASEKLKNRPGEIDQAEAATTTSDHSSNPKVQEATASQKLKSCAGDVDQAKVATITADHISNPKDTLASQQKKKTCAGDVDQAEVATATSDHGSNPKVEDSHSEDNASEASETKVRCPRYRRREPQLSPSAQYDAAFSCVSEDALKLGAMARGFPMPFRPPPGLEMPSWPALAGPPGFFLPALEQPEADDRSEAEAAGSSACSTADTDAYAPAPGQLGSAEMPTKGSAGHHVGLCKPCAFVQKGGCESGVDCIFCHLCPPGEKSRRKKELKTQRQQRKQTKSRGC